MPTRELTGCLLHCAREGDIDQVHGVDSIELVFDNLHHAVNEVVRGL